MEKMPKEMLIWHKQTLKSEKGYKSRSNDRFGFIAKIKFFYNSMCCYFHFVLCLGRGGSGERFPVMVAPRAVILLSAPAQRRRSLCGAVCVVVRVFMQTKPSAFIITVLWSISARWRLRGCGLWLCRCLRASWRRRWRRSGLGSPAPASCGR